MIEAFLALVGADKSNEFNAPVQVEQGLSSKLRETHKMAESANLNHINGRINGRAYRFCG